MTDHRAVIDELEARGFQFLRTTKHQHLYVGPGGDRIGVPTTPGDHRSYRNTIADIRRTLQRPLAPQTIPDKDKPVTIPDPTPTIASAHQKTCKVCGNTLPEEMFQRSYLPTVAPGTRLNTCMGCVAARHSATKTARALEKAAAKPDPTALAPIPPGRARFRKLETMSAPSPASTTPARATDSPEEMALRVLKARHAGEYDAILVDMMAALGWNQ